MKVVIYFLGLATLLLFAGCEDEHHHHHEGERGGAYGGPGYFEHGHGEYEGYPNYHDHHEDWH